MFFDLENKNTLMNFNIFEWFDCHKQICSQKHLQDSPLIAHTAVLLRCNNATLLWRKKKNNL